MTDPKTLTDEPCGAGPLVERLRAVPANGRLLIHGEYWSHSYPVGPLCHEAADAIERATREQSSTGGPDLWYELEGVIDDMRHGTTNTEVSIETLRRVQTGLAPPGRTASTRGPVAVVADTNGVGNTMSWLIEPALPVGTKLYGDETLREALDQIANLMGDCEEWAVTNDPGVVVSAVKDYMAGGSAP
jgi:hypothetical protein